MPYKSICDFFVLSGHLRPGNSIGHIHQKHQAHSVPGQIQRRADDTTEAKRQNHGCWGKTKEAESDFLFLQQEAETRLPASCSSISIAQIWVIDALWDTLGQVEKNVMFYVLFEQMLGARQDRMPQHTSPCWRETEVRGWRGREQDMGPIPLPLRHH